MTVKKKLNSNFVWWNKTKLKSSSSSVVSVGKKSPWRVAFLLSKPQLAQDLQCVISLLFHSLSIGSISKITTKFLGLSGWITSVPAGDPFCWLYIDCTVHKKNADWGVQEARTEAARCGDKSSLHIQFDGFYLIHDHYSNNNSATVHNAKTGRM